MITSVSTRKVEPINHIHYVRLKKDEQSQAIMKEPQQETLDFPIQTNCVVLNLTVDPLFLHFMCRRAYGNTKGVTP